MRKPDNALAAQIDFVTGASGSGKSHVVKERICREPQVLVWDAKNEYGDLPGFRTTHRKDEFIRLARAGGRVALAAPPSEFDFWARVVWARGACLCVAEELAAVTGVAKASGAWHLIVSQGRGYGIRTVGVAQRAAEVDKTLIGNLSRLHVRRLNFAADRVAMAGLLDVPLAEVAALTGYHHIERDMTTGRVFNSMKQAAPAGRNFAQKAPRKRG